MIRIKKRRKETMRYLREKGDLIFFAFYDAISGSLAFLCIYWTLLEESVKMITFFVRVTRK